MKGMKRGVCCLCDAPSYSPKASYCDEHFGRPLSIETEMARALRSGELRPIKECECVDCGAPAEHYDHRDYGKPLEVDPVCFACNMERGPAVRPWGPPITKPPALTRCKSVEELAG